MTTMQLWIKSRFAHLVLLPSRVNPMVRRWQRLDLPIVEQVVERTEVWESGSFAAYDTNPDTAILVRDALREVDPQFVVDIAVSEEGKVYVLAKGVPMWADLDAITEGDDQARRLISEGYAKSMLARVSGLDAKVGELIAALSYALRLTDETHYLEGGKVKVAPISDPHSTGAYGFGAWVACEALNALDADTIKQIRQAWRSWVDKSELYRAVKGHTDGLLDILYRELGGRWEHMSEQEVIRKLGEAKVAKMVNHINFLAEFLREHNPAILAQMGWLDDEGNLTIPRWQTLRAQLYSGTKKEKGFPTLIDAAITVAAKEEGNRQADPPLLESVYKSVGRDTMRKIATLFKQKLSEPIPPSVKEVIGRIGEKLELPPSMRERVKKLKEATYWRGLFKKDLLSYGEAIQFYLFTLGQLVM